MDGRIEFVTEKTFIFFVDPEQEVQMFLKTILFGKSYKFPDIRILMEMVNEDKSGYHLAGVAADTTPERVDNEIMDWTMGDLVCSLLEKGAATPYKPAPGSSRWHKS